MKDGGVGKQIDQIKKVQEHQEEVSNFFQERDKRKRGTGGLIEDVAETLGNEAEEKERLYLQSLSEKELPSSIIPMFNTLFLTARRNKVKNAAGLFLPTASFGGEGNTDLELDFADTQKVLACGPQVQMVVPGMEVKLIMDNFKRRLDVTMAQKVNKDFEYFLPVEVINDIEYIKITERDISYISDSMSLKLKEHKK